MTLNNVISLLCRHLNSNMLLDTEIYEIDIDSDSIYIYFADLNQPDIEITKTGTVKYI